MPADLTSTGLIASIRRNAALGPGNANAFPSDSDLLAWTNEEMSNSLVTMLMRPREEYFVAYYAVPIVSGTAEYRIPIRSMWDNTRDVQALWSGTTQWVPLPRIQPEQALDYDWNGGSGQNACAYYLRAGYVVLVPTPTSALSVRIKYFLRPGNIVSSDSYTALSGLTGSSSPYTATVAATSKLTGSTSFDFTASFAPYDVVLTSVAGTIASGTTLSLTLSAADAATLSGAIASGVYALAAGDAPGPQIPQDLASYLEQCATYRALIGKKDAAGAELQMKACNATKAALVQAMNARTDGLNRKIVDRKFVPGRRWGGGGYFPG